MNGLPFLLPEHGGRAEIPGAGARPRTSGYLLYRPGPEVKKQARLTPAVQKFVEFFPVKEQESKPRER